jgi:hypothetical protein
MYTAEPHDWSTATLHDFVLRAFLSSFSVISGTIGIIANILPKC